MKIVVILFKGFRKVIYLLKGLIYTPSALAMFYVNGATVGTGIRVQGFAKVFITRRGKLLIGNNCRINSGEKYNIIGRQQKMTFWVEGNLIIGNDVGMSAVAIICKKKINIGNNVVIGGNTVIYDTDFHSLDSFLRNSEDDQKNAKTAPVLIEDNVFIGAHSTILKGVKIGKNSIIGACSVVAKDIPENEIWAGNPAKFIRKINEN